MTTQAPAVEILNPEVLSSPEDHPSPIDSRCRHRYDNGKRCRLPARAPEPGLCTRHAALRVQQADSGDFSAELVCGIDEFRSPQDINHVLGELYKLLAANKISPRRGAVMAYTCNLLLRTLPAIEHELEPPEEEQQCVFDLPRPQRHEWHEDMDPAVTAYPNWAAFIAANPQHAGARPEDFLRPPSTPEKKKDFRP